MLGQAMPEATRSTPDSDAGDTCIVRGSCLVRSRAKPYSPYCRQSSMLVWMLDLWLHHCSDIGSQHSGLDGLALVVLHAVTVALPTPLLPPPQRTSNDALQQPTRSRSRLPMCRHHLLSLPHLHLLSRRSFSDSSPLRFPQSRRSSRESSLGEGGGRILHIAHSWPGQVVVGCACLLLDWR